MQLNIQNHKNLVFGSRRKPNQTFQNFLQFAKEQNISENIYNIVTNTDNYISEGMNGRTFRIPQNDDFVLKVPKIMSTGELQHLPAVIEEIINPFKSLNVGQPIAKIGRVLVLLKQEGTEHGLPLRRKGKFEKQDIELFISEIKKIASISQDGYNNFTDEVKEVRKHGLYVDIWNSNNILINNDEINLVDISKVKNLLQKYNKRISKTGLIRLFIDEISLRAILPHLNKDEICELGRNFKTISDKMGIAMKHSKLPQRIVFNEIMAACSDLIRKRKKVRIETIIKQIINAGK